MPIRWSTLNHIGQRIANSFRSRRPRLSLGIQYVPSSLMLCCLFGYIAISKPCTSSAISVLMSITLQHVTRRADDSIQSTRPTHPRHVGWGSAHEFCQCTLSSPVPCARRNGTPARAREERLRGGRGARRWDAVGCGVRRRGGGAQCVSCANGAPLRLGALGNTEPFS